MNSEVSIEQQTETSLAMTTNGSEDRQAQSANMVSDAQMDQEPASDSGTTHGAEVSDIIKSKIENLDFDGAIEEYKRIIDESAQYFQQLKKIKFDYMVQTCELFTRIDFPSIMMESCRKEVGKRVPKPKELERMEF